ncbi:MAG TPA: phosphoadenosine phosphosulfate reductase family protein [Syntrophomonadaceae bacterium]|nr:phosphoadenosine phosphosulfate reductase family protein [Syntrophomonadaceae bacterium]
MKHIVSFSGGKDSTLMLLMMLEKGMSVDDIIFADTGMEFQELYDYIERIEGVIGRKITRLRPKKTWDDLFFAKKKKGNNIGQIYGFPMTKELRLMRKRYPDEYAKLMWYGEQAEKNATSRRFAEYKRVGRWQN